MEGKFYDIERIWDRAHVQNLMDAVVSQKYFTLVVYNALESRFENNHIMVIFKVLGLTNMSS